MNWEAISAIGQLIGAVAVIITIIYLAIQMKQNTAAVATSTYESTMSIIHCSLEPTYENPLGSIGCIFANLFAEIRKEIIHKTVVLQYH